MQNTAENALQRKVGEFMTHGQLYVSHLCAKEILDSNLN